MIAFKHKQIILLPAAMMACLIFHLFWIVPWVFADNKLDQTAQLAPDQIMIEVKATNHVNTSRIFLGDIAEISASSFLLETIKNIEIGPSPKPEKIIAIDKQKIIFKLKVQKYLPKNLVLICPEKVFVKRLGQNISKQQIEDFIHQQLGINFPSRAYQLKSLKIRGIEPYPRGDISFNIDAEKWVDRKGRLSCYLDLFVNGVKSDRLNVSGTVAVYEQIVFAAKSLSRGDKISPDDIYMKKGNIFDFNLSVIHDFEAVKGKILKSSVRKDTSLTRSILSDPPLVKKGDLITITAKNKNLRIVASGISMEDGFINELIKVENLHSGKFIRGIVTEKSKVEVVY